ncbi:hypothetical protein HZ326_23694 [Fusarium oxysporum f. sp. albedinis]|nr:hypothetical protein HZ326_23694 [Fusarium oxysporum f. sp. albedinis]
MTLANDSMAWAGRYPGRLHNDVLNKVSFVLPIELAERVVKQAVRYYWRPLCVFLSLSNPGGNQHLGLAKLQKLEMLSFYYNLLEAAIICTKRGFALLRHFCAGAPADWASALVFGQPALLPVQNFCQFVSGLLSDNFASYISGLRTIVCRMVDQFTLISTLLSSEIISQIMANPQDYTVGWICALTIESVAAQAFLDEEHEGPRAVAQNDNNNYALGRIGSHNIVIAVLPDGEYGTAVAAAVARDMLGSFPNIRIGLLVGVGGGAPSPNHDIRLGDIVVSSRDSGKGGVFQYDFGKTIQNQSFQETGFLNQPPTVLRAAVNALKGRYDLKGHRLNNDVDMALKKIKKRKKYSRPPASSDRLYRADIIHPPNSSEGCSVVCGDDPFHILARAERDEEDDNPAIHYGLVASANQLMKDALVRDKLAAEKSVLCFEMEAAGLMNHFPCLVIRGICDYSDSHKNKEWQGFAAMAAAAYAKDLLRHIPPNKVEAERRIGEVLSSIGTALNDVQETSNVTKVMIETVRSNQHVAEIKDWLSPPDSSTNANHARKLRHEGTGEWCLNSAAFREWETGSRRHLWLYGLPGCGKTVLSTTILDHLMNIDDHIILDFFFDFSDTTKQTVDGMLRSLVFRLYKLGLSSSRELDGLFKSHHDGKDQPATKTLLGCLHTMMRGPIKIFLVLDALDESTTRVELLEWMKDVISTPELGHVRLIATGRPEAEFQREIPHLIGKENCLLLDKDSINTDIRSYVMARLEQSPEFAKWASCPSVLKQIRNEIGGKPDGMFRWAACQLDSLETCLDREGVEIALRSLPHDLNETYNRILQRIPPERKHKAIRLLQFLVCSERPLTLKEAVDVIAVRIDSRPGYFDPVDRLPCPSEITRFCPSLVSIVHGSHGDQDAVEELQLAHFSVKEYLLNYQVQGFLHAEASIAITQTCLAYLNSLEEGGVAIIKSQFPLAEYAAKIWMDHTGPAEVSKDIVAAAVSFLENDELFRLWTRLYQPDWPWVQRPNRTQASCLYIACLAGLTETVRVLLSTNRNVNAQGGYYGTALQAASAKGRKEVVRLLLDEGADVNAQGGRYGGALQAASGEGHTEIVRLLLNEGADVNTQGEYCTALLLASVSNHKEIVRLLLEKGADVNALDSLYGTALQAASGEGHTEIVRRLLNEGADVNAQNDHYDTALQAYGTALQAASGEGHEEIVRLLLNEGADVNTQEDHYGTALQAASAQGLKEIVQLLLNEGADVNAQGGHYGTALQAASARCHEEIVQLLLNEGADVNTQGGRYGTALQAASYGGHEEIVRLLLNEGADVNTQGGHYCYLPEAYDIAPQAYGTALQAASGEGHEEIVRLLLNEGADVNTQEDHYGTALQAASAKGHEDIVRLLLYEKADVNAQGGEYGTALRVASAKGHEEIVRLLLNGGADVNAQGGEYGTALRAASYGGHEEIVRLLLNEGADVNTQGGRYGTALQAASYGGHEEVVRLLLNEGADVNTQDGHYCYPRKAYDTALQAYSTALQAASAKGHEDIVRLLLYEKADVNAQGGEYGTALRVASAKGHEEIVRLLLNGGADVNAQGGGYCTALQAASYGGRKEVVRLLLDEGADVNAQGGLYGTALQAASAKGHEEIASLLWNATYKLSPPSKRRRIV